MQTPLLDTDQPEIAQRICAVCAWSRGNSPTGPLFEGHNLIFCVQPDVSQGDGSPVHCMEQRTQPASLLHAICGEEAIFFTPRNQA